MRLGAPVFASSDDPEQLARAHRALGLRAAYCPPVKLGDTDRLRAIEQAFAKHDVVIAEVGVWNNLMDPNEEKRRANVRAMCDGLALADADGGTEILAVHDGLPPGVPAADNELGWQSSLDKLAALVETG